MLWWHSLQPVNGTLRKPELSAAFSPKDNKFSCWQSHLSQASARGSVSFKKSTVLLISVKAAMDG